jgi:hypothetical protein
MRRGAAVAVMTSWFLASATTAPCAPEGEGAATNMPPGDVFVCVHTNIPVRRGQPPVQTTCWLPKGCEYVRGVIVAGSYGSVLPVRKVAVEEGLGIAQGHVRTGTGKDTLALLDRVFEAWAKASGHPEIRGAAVLTASISAGVIWARNVGYAAPERVMGVVHIAGGNMHHGMVDERKTLAGVPFIAFNGEFEGCGPDGGIRPHLGYDTQWYMLAEAMLERRKEDPNNLMSMVVIPCRGHTAYNWELGALFLKKCAQYRLPKEKRDGSTPARCLEIKVEHGWLTDRDVKHPKHAAAPCNEYTGDKSQAFWHFDKEMALAVCKYHEDGIRPGQGRSLFRPEGLFDELWPMGEKMEIPFDELPPDRYEAAIREWIIKKSANRLDGWLVKALAAGIAPGIVEAWASASGGATGAAVKPGAKYHVPREMCQRVCYAYDDAFRPVEQAIEKAVLPVESKALLREHYAEKILTGRPGGSSAPDMSIRGIEAWIGALPAGSNPQAVKAALADAASRKAVMAKLYGAEGMPRPPELDKWLEQTRDKDAKVAWAAVDELGRIGAPAIPDLARNMDFDRQPVNFRAAAALGRMGKAAACVLPDLRRASLRGGISEMDSIISPMALEAIEKIEKGGGDAQKASGPAE